MHTDLMIDFETLNTHPDSVALSLGLVAFSREGPSEAMATLYLPFKPQEQIAKGRSISVDTISWWMEQNAAVRLKAFKEGNRVSMQHGMASAEEFIRQACTEDVWVWGNGSDFDNTIYRDLCRATQRELPWKWTNNRCYRTLRKLHPEVELIEEFGDAHDPVDDAIKQAKNVRRILAGGE